MTLQSRRRFKDETGNSYGKLTVLRFERMWGEQPFFACRCDCGKEVSIRGANLRSGNTRSCGCSRSPFRVDSEPAAELAGRYPLRLLRSRISFSEYEILAERLTFHPPTRPRRSFAARALLLQALYSVRSERLLMEQLDYNLLFRWFVGLNMDDAIWDVTVFTKNRERLLDGDIAEAFFQAVLQQARERRLLSDEHFTVDGTLLEAWASVKSYQRKDAKNTVPPDDPGNATVDFHGEKRSNQTHASKTDPDAKMARKGKGKEAKLSYNGNLLVENRNGLIVNTEVFEANGTAERDAALVMLEQIPGTRQVTVGGDKGYDTADFVAECRNMKVTPHVAQNLERPGGSAIDARTTQHPGYAISQRKRKRIEECFGWLKTIALLRKVRHRGVLKVGWVFTFAAAAYNLVRLRNLARHAT